MVAGEVGRSGTCGGLFLFPSHCSLLGGVWSHCLHTALMWQLARIIWFGESVGWSCRNTPHSAHWMPLIDVRKFQNRHRRAKKNPLKTNSPLISEMMWRAHKKTKGPLFYDCAVLLGLIHSRDYRGVGLHDVALKILYVGQTPPASVFRHRIIQDVLFEINVWITNPRER